MWLCGIITALGVKAITEERLPGRLMGGAWEARHLVIRYVTTVQFLPPPPLQCFCFHLSTQSSVPRVDPAGRFFLGGGN